VEVEKVKEVQEVIEVLEMYLKLTSFLPTLSLSSTNFTSLSAAAMHSLARAFWGSKSSERLKRVLALGKSCTCR
jgi:hypothetical protein